MGNDRDGGRQLRGSRGKRQGAWGREHGARGKEHWVGDRGRDEREGGENHPPARFIL